MKKQRKLRTRLTVTMTALTCGVLLAVMLVFNVAVQSYIRSRVSTQLDAVTRSVSEERRGDQGGEQRFDERPDRVIDAEYSAAVLAEDGSVIKVLHGDWIAAQQLADEARTQGLAVGASAEVFQSELATYAYCLQADPVESGHRLLIYADVTAVTAFTQRVNLILLLVILAAVGISVLLSRRFAKSFSQPVQALSDFAADIGGGKLERRALDFRDGELRQLADAMNRMVGELDQAKQKQETFFQNVSHELRTPLTSIRGNAEGILYGVIEPKAAGKVILSESDKLGGMVEDILFLSRMGKGRQEGEAELVDLREVLSLCVSEQHTEAEKKGLTFAFDFDEDPVLLAIREADAERLFGNLISNAVRYASREIQLRCHAADGKITVRVADDGPGIAEADLPHVFERFYKGKDGKHGIGLAIAKAAAEAWHGNLQVRNDGGAVFEAIFESTPTALLRNQLGPSLI